MDAHLARVQAAWNSFSKEELFVKRWTQRDLTRAPTRQKPLPTHIDRLQNAGDGIYLLFTDESSNAILPIEKMAERVFREWMRDRSKMDIGMFIRRFGTRYAGTRHEDTRWLIKKIKELASDDAPARFVEGSQSAKDPNQKMGESQLPIDPMTASLNFQDKFDFSHRDYEGKAVGRYFRPSDLVHQNKAKKRNGELLSLSESDSDDEEDAEPVYLKASKLVPSVSSTNPFSKSLTQSQGPCLETESLVTKATAISPPPQIVRGSCPASCSIENTGAVTSSSSPTGNIAFSTPHGVKTIPPPLKAPATPTPMRKRPGVWKPATPDTKTSARLLVTPPSKPEQSLISSLLEAINTPSPSKPVKQPLVTLPVAAKTEPLRLSRASSPGFGAPEETLMPGRTDERRARDNYRDRYDDVERCETKGYRQNFRDEYNDTENFSIRSRSRETSDQYRHEGRERPDVSRPRGWGGSHRSGSPRRDRSNERCPTRHIPYRPNVRIDIRDLPQPSRGHYDKYRESHVRNEHISMIAAREASGRGQNTARDFDDSVPNGPRAMSSKQCPPRSLPVRTPRKDPTVALDPPHLASDPIIGDHPHPGILRRITSSRSLQLVPMTPPKRGRTEDNTTSVPSSKKSKGNDLSDSKEVDNPSTANLDRFKNQGHIIPDLERDGQ